MEKGGELLGKLNMAEGRVVLVCNDTLTPPVCDSVCKRKGHFFTRALGRGFDEGDAVELAGQDWPPHVDCARGEGAGQLVRLHHKGKSWFCRPPPSSRAACRRSGWRT